MKIILTQDFETLGFEGDVVDVAKGYARNYLMPKGVGVLADNANLKAFEMRKEKIMARRLKDKEAAEKVKEKVSQMTLTFIQKAGEEGKLYGSVTTIDIARAIHEQTGIDIDRRRVSERPLRELGVFEVPIRMGAELTPVVRVVILPEEKVDEYLQGLTEVLEEVQEMLVEDDVVEEAPVELSAEETQVSMPTQVIEADEAETGESEEEQAG